MERGELNLQIVFSANLSLIRQANPSFPAASCNQDAKTALKKSISSF
jgi:hypothetical protein